MEHEKLYKHRFSKKSRQGIINLLAYLQTSCFQRYRRIPEMKYTVFQKQSYTIIISSPLREGGRAGERGREREFERAGERGREGEQERKGETEVGRGREGVRESGREIGREGELERERERENSGERDK